LVVFACQQVRIGKSCGKKEQCEGPKNQRKRPWVWMFKRRDLLIALYFHHMYVEEVNVHWGGKEPIDKKERAGIIFRGGGGGELRGLKDACG